VMYKGFKVHAENVEPYQPVLPHLGNHGRESPQDFDESISDEELLRATCTHLIPPDDLALALGVLVPETFIKNQDSV
ncbi:hypothetical protein KI387_022170, partial [Taxus chinensis]